MTETKLDRPPGRPRGSHPRQVAGGRGRLLSASISQETYSLLKTEADRSGLSISQVAENWINTAGRNALGLSPAVATGFEQLAALARAIDSAITDKRMAHFVTLDAITEVLPSVIGLAPASPNASNELLANALLIHTLGCISEALNSAAKDDPVACRAKQPPSSGGTKSIGELLAEPHVAFANTALHILIGALEDLQAAGSTGNNHITAGLEMLDQVRERESAEAAEYRRAQETAKVLAKRFVEKLTRPPGDADDASTDIAPGAAFRAAFPQ